MKQPMRFSECGLPTLAGEKERKRLAFSNLGFPVYLCSVFVYMRSVYGMSPKRKARKRAVLGRF